MAILLSLFNLRKGGIRLTGLAVSYSVVVIGFHLLFMTLWGAHHTAEFPLYVAGAQGVIAFIAYETGCKAAKIVMPLAWFAVLINCLTWLQSIYPSPFYFYTSNFIQGAQVASLIFASSLWHGLALQIKRLTRKDNNKGMSYERAG